MTIIRPDFQKGARTGGTISTRSVITHGTQTFFHQTNADSEDIRVCHPGSRMPIAKPKKGVTYPLLAYYVMGNPVYYENAAIMGAYDREKEQIIDVETAAWGVGIYVESKYGTAHVLKGPETRQP